MGPCRLLLIRLLLSFVMRNVTSFPELECNALKTPQEGTIMCHVDFCSDSCFLDSSKYLKLNVFWLGWRRSGSRPQ
jgi:hypothetical protein